MKMTEMQRAAATWVRSLLGGTDTRRWAADTSYDPWWDERTRLMTAAVRPGSTVIDVGAGQMAARAFLPESCRYVPLDVVARAPESVVCDLNSGPLPALTADWMLMSGVLEYVHDLPQALAWAAATAPNLSVSFTPLEAGIPRVQRLAWGWVQHLPRAEFDRLLAEAGFRVDQEQTWWKQTLIVARHT